MTTDWNGTCPALLIICIAPLTSSRGGSLIPTSPTNVKSLSSEYMSSSTSLAGVLFTSNLRPPSDFLHKARTRWPWLDHSDWRVETFRRMLLSNGTRLPSALSVELQAGNKTSGAPLISMNGSPACFSSARPLFSRMTVSIHLFLELKGISKSLSCDATIESISIPLFSFVKDSVKRRIAVSVASPLIVLSSSGAESPASTNDAPLQRRATSTSDFREAGVGSSGLVSMDLISRKERSRKAILSSD